MNIHIHIHMYMRVHMYCIIINNETSKQRQIEIGGHICMYVVELYGQMHGEYKLIALIFYFFIFHFVFIAFIEIYYNAWW